MTAFRGPGGRLGTALGHGSVCQYVPQVGCGSEGNLGDYCSHQMAVGWAAIAVFGWLLATGFGPGNSSILSNNQCILSAIAANLIARGRIEWTVAVVQPRG